MYQEAGMTPAFAASIDHIGLNIPEESFGFWRELLAYLGFTIEKDGNHFDAQAASGAFVCVTATKDAYLEAGYHRRHTGLSHLALRVASVTDVDAFVTEFLTPRGITPLYGGARSYDYTPGYYAAYAEDPSKLKIEVMTDDAD
jgi:catechol 2,3-dioxygenase-like lactoylglutathione lyase family enzyme